MVAQIDSVYTKFGFNKTIRRFVSYLIFEGRPNTTKGQWLNPIVFLVLKILKSLPGSSAITKPIFITGLGRSGTTILGVIMSLHRDVGFLNEPKAIWRLIDSRHDTNNDYGTKNGRFRLYDADVTEHAAVTATRLFKRYLSIVRSNRLVDKYPELIFRTGYLLKLFPDAKIIFITRNGNDATHSIDLWSKRLGVQKRGVVEDWWGKDDTKWRNMIEQIISIDPYYKDVRQFASSDLDHTNRAALEWIITMREGLFQKDNYSDSIYQIKYEDLTSRKSELMREMLEWCELDIDHSVLDYSDESLFTNNSKPSPNLLPEINRIYNETMALLGYN